jgi:hypothetical protein
VFDPIILNPKDRIEVEVDWENIKDHPQIRKYNNLIIK